MSNWEPEKITVYKTNWTMVCNAFALGGVIAGLGVAGFLSNHFAEKEKEFRFEEAHFNSTLGMMAALDKARALQEIKVEAKLRAVLHLKPGVPLP